VSSAKKITQQIVEYRNPWFDVLAKDVTSGDTMNTSRYYMIRPADYVVILAVTEAGEIILVRQYRPAIEDYTLELPSGHVEPGEEPAVTAARELLEETGYAAKDLEFLGDLAPDTGRLANKLWCYSAQAVRLAKGTPVGEPGIEMLLHPKKQLSNLIATGQLRHAHDLAVIALAMAKKSWGCDHAG
jgi:ADP-ribose pyrophosphatase